MSLVGISAVELGIGFKLILVTLFFVCVVEGKNTFLLSYPRSGNTWLRVCLEFMTHRPTLSYHVHAQHVKIYSRPLGEVLPLDTDFSLAPVWKVHNKNRMQKIGYDPQQDILILLLRDYKECLHNNLATPQEVYREILDPHSTYYDNLLIFTAWDPEHRYLIYYEDLLKDPQKEMENLLTFLDVKARPLEDLIANLATLQAASLSFYCQYVRPQREKTPLTSGFRKKIDQQVRNTYPALWETYLCRYDSLCR